MLRPQPYFMTNEDWFYEEQTSQFTVKYHLTELGKSIPEVVKSYEEEQEFLKNNRISDIVGASEMIKEIIEEMRAEYKEQGLSDEEIEQKINEWKSKLA